ncbi:MAG: CPBP family intramembrane glutamic endopeptidase [Fidelibacterota bacterium]
MNTKASYFHQTHTPLYSFVLTLPLFILYEIGILTISRHELYTLRNGADVLMRHIMNVFGLYGFYGFSVVISLGFILTYIYQRRRFQKMAIRGDFLIYMLLESIVLGFGLYLFIGYLQSFLMSPVPKNLIQQVILSIGAGLYEEFVFRVVLISLLVWVLQLLLKWKKIARKVGALVGAAILFSLFHFVGNYGDLPAWDLFFLRLAAGILLGLIYIWRGFGVTAYSHTVYNLIVVVTLTTQSVKLS